MRAVTVYIEDEVAADLDLVCAEEGRDKGDVIGDLVRRYVRNERMRKALADPGMISLYEELADEDVALAEEGLPDFAETLAAADRA